MILPVSTNGKPRDDAGNVRKWPWTDGRSKLIANTQPGDSILRRKAQPKDFDYTKHTPDDLPADPLTVWKAIWQVMQMRNTGLFDKERFVSAETRKKGLEAASNHPGSQYITSGPSS